MKVRLRPATKDDFAKFIDEPLPWRVRAFAGVRGDELLGIGGLAFLPDGTVAAFLHIAPEARRYKIALHKAGLRTMEEVRRLGLRRVVALAQKDNPAAEPWLLRLGFRPTQVDDETAWVWTKDD